MENIKNGTIRNVEGYTCIEKIAQLLGCEPTIEAIFYEIGRLDEKASKNNNVRVPPLPPLKYEGTSNGTPVWDLHKPSC